MVDVLGDGGGAVVEVDDRGTVLDWVVDEGLVEATVTGTKLAVLMVVGGVVNVIGGAWSCASGGATY